MSRRPSCQEIKAIAYFVFWLATRRWEKKKQRRTRAAQQRDYRRAAHLKEDPGCSSADLAVRNRQMQQSHDLTPSVTEQSIVPLPISSASPISSYAAHPKQDY